MEIIYEIQNNIQFYNMLRFMFVRTRKFYTGLILYLLNPHPWTPPPYLETNFVHRED